MRSVVEKTAPRSLSEAKTKASVYVIAGPNGAGKTTFAKTFLPQYLDCKVFINADLIAGGLAPLAPDQVQLKAGKLLLNEIREAAGRGVDFGFETTLAGRSYVKLFREFIQAGYAIHLFFLWIPNVEISIKRIRERVRRGGHDIPEPVVRRRFHRGIENLFKLYERFLTSWMIFDNSTPKPETVAYRLGEKHVVISEPSFAKIKSLAGAS
ncbi:MAG: zeta toxin family protein [Candidatus Omnitrophica bacterium]|nr:zeta toxin family protein [Candidatus Omnitrophota bacterium]